MYSEFSIVSLNELPEDILFLITSYLIPTPPMLADSNVILYIREMIKISSISKRWYDWSVGVDCQSYFWKDLLFQYMRKQNIRLNFDFSLDEEDDEYFSDDRGDALRKGDHIGFTFGGPATSRRILLAITMNPDKIKHMLFHLDTYFFHDIQKIQKHHNSKLSSNTSISRSRESFSVLL
ncbi:hypothetical protein ABK040_008729 [Willaertia magna]